MLDKVKHIVHSQNLTQTDQLLLILSLEKNTPKSTKVIRELAAQIGISNYKKMNIPQLLRGSKGKAINTPSGWELGPKGINSVEKYGISLNTGTLVHVASELREETKSISNPNIKSFIDEAITSLEQHSYRSAIIVSWIGAIGILYEYVLENKLTELNAEATRRNSRWTDAVNFDDLADMKEDSFLDICHKISILGKSVKDELKNCLQRRNGAGHPNSFEIGENMVKAHIEALIKNVYTKY